MQIDKNSFTNRTDVYEALNSAHCHEKNVEKTKAK